MYDFDRLFSDFIKSKGHVHEDEIAKVYSEWYNAYSDALGTSPREIVEGMTDAQLVSELRDECEVSSPSLTVMENLESRAPVKLLTSLLYDDDENVAYCAAEILTIIDKAPLSDFVELLPSAEGELLELIVTALKERPDEIKEQLYSLADTADRPLKTVLVEILAEGSKDERTYKLLSELLASGDNMPLYANYCVRYGDERIVAMLYRALETAGYADYIEIRNAIEALGGIVDDERDFSADPEYILLKEKLHDGKK